MGKRRYSDEDRAKALTILDACGGNFLQASRESGIPRATLQEWDAGRVSDAVPGIRQTGKVELAGLFADFVTRAVGLTTDEDIKAAKLKDRFMAIGYAVDKMQLLRGEPTSIDEQRDAARLEEFRKRYAAGHAGANGDSQPVRAADADGAADHVP